MTQSTDPAQAGALFAAAARAVARGGDLDATLDALLAIVTADRAATAAVVGVLGEDEGLHELRAAGIAARPATDEASAAPLAGAIDGAAEVDPIAAAIRDRRPSIAVAEGGTPPGLFAARHDLERVEAVPLIVSEAGIERAVGVLALGWGAGRAPREGTPGILDAIADLAAVAIRHAAVSAGAAEQGEWQERLAHLDPLTGLANRRTLDRVLELEIARAARLQSDISVAVFDVDSFRSTNEGHGAPAGDAVLRAVAAVLAEQVRLVDTVARIGGDEFAVVAPGSGGVTVADRIMRAIEALGPVRGIAVSVSAGIARFPADGTTADELLEAALGALDGARAAGLGAIGEVRSR